MAADALSNDPIYVLPAELHPDVDHLVTEDDITRTHRAPRVGNHHGERDEYGWRNRKVLIAAGAAALIFLLAGTIFIIKDKLIRRSLVKMPTWNAPGLKFA